MKERNLTVSRKKPLPAEWTVERGLVAYLDENGFKREDYDSAWTPAAILGVPVYVPNTAKHRWAIMLHDLHHVATGYGTDTTGEGEISAWEFRNGIRSVGFYVGLIVVGGLLIGFVFATKKTIAAWNLSVGGNSLFSMSKYKYEDLLEMSIGDLREFLGVKRDGHYSGFRELHSGAPKQG